MKKVLLSLVAITCLTFTVKAQEFSFGAGAQFNIDAEIFGVQGKAVYNLNEMLDITGAFTYYLDDAADYELDFNVQYKLLELGESFDFYPQAGFSMFRVSAFGFGATNTSLHIGGSFRLPGETMTIYIEPKFVFDGSAFVISGGVLF
jgi:hypothetical protein